MNKKNTTKQSHLFYKIVRFLIALMLGLLPTIYCYKIISASSPSVNVPDFLHYTDQKEDSGFRIDELMISFVEELSKTQEQELFVSNLANTPRGLFKYNLKVLNNSKFNIATGEEVFIKINLGMGKEYKEFKFGESIIPIDNLDVLNPKGLVWSASLYIKGHEEEKLKDKILVWPIEGYNNVELKLQLAWSSILFIFMFWMVTSYAFLLILAKWWKFIIHGEPFVLTK